MALIAQEDAFVTDADGIRRKVSKGAPIPAHLAAGMDTQTEEVETRSLSRPVVDEEASLSHAERAKRASGGRGSRKES